MFAGGLILTACDGLSLFQPTPIPTLTYDEEIEEEMEEIEESARELLYQGNALAIRLSGDNVIDCGEVEDWDWMEDDIENHFFGTFYWAVNDCTLEAYQKKQAFRILINRAVDDASYSTWIVAKPDNAIYFLMI
jgi:hypothetical protein